MFKLGNHVRLFSQQQPSTISGGGDVVKRQWSSFPIRSLGAFSVGIDLYLVTSIFRQWPELRHDKQPPKFIFGQRPTKMPPISLNVGQGDIREGVGNEPMRSTTPVAEADGSFAVAVACGSRHVLTRHEHQPSFQHRCIQVRQSPKRAFGGQPLESRLHHLHTLRRTPLGRQVSAVSIKVPGDRHRRMIGGGILCGRQHLCLDQFRPPSQIGKNGFRSVFRSASRPHLPHHTGTVAVAGGVFVTGEDDSVGAVASGRYLRGSLASVSVRPASESPTGTGK
ncbi:MAG: hypothetical protein FWD61_19125 [Phycisphaerales bacterium]|nr:hypothetical protein [Phycisphaerales bacterium]